MFNKVTIKGAKQAVQMFGPAQRGVAMAVADSVADGTIPADEADNLFICVGVFIHWMAEDDAKIQDYNYRATPGDGRAPGPWSVSALQQLAHPLAQALRADLDGRQRLAGQQLDAAEQAAAEGAAPSPPRRCG
jgi:hypothetical protein